MSKRKKGERGRYTAKKTQAVGSPAERRGPGCGLPRTRGHRSIQTALIQIDEEVARHMRGEETIGTLEQLRHCRETLRSMEKSLHSGKLPPRNERPSGMGRMIVDAWPIGTELGTLLLRIEQAYIRL